MMRVWRITRKTRRKDAFSGVRSALAGGRWNSTGRRVVYCAKNPALAALEVLVHMETSQPPQNYVIIPMDIPDGEPCQVIDAAGLPGDWQDPDSDCCKELGDAWYESTRTLFLDVPSAVMPLERNIVINPNHPKFKELDTSHAGYPLRFDPRLLAIVDQKSINYM